MNRKKKIIISVIASTLAVAIATVFLCLGIMYFPYTTPGSAYGIMQIDLSVEPDGVPEELRYLYELTTLDGGDGGERYLAHPDSILLNKGTDNEVVFTSYVKGHGRGELFVKLSSDGGKSYGERIANTPDSWKRSEETPTLYELDFMNGDKKCIMVSANPKWPGYLTGDGFNVSVSDDGGATWLEFQKFYGKKSEKRVNAIVAMSSLTRLKKDGKFVDEWMGLFHDDSFRCYKSILTFSADGQMSWSRPEEFLKNSVDENGKKIDQTFKAKMAKACEIEAIRSAGGGGM